MSGDREPFVPRYDEHGHVVEPAVTGETNGARCRHCDSTELELVWAAMTWADSDAWRCANGHTFAGLPSRLPLPLTVHELKAALARAQATLVEQHTEPVGAHCEPGVPCFPFGCDGPVSCRCRCHALNDCDCTTCRLARAQATIAAVRALCDKASGADRFGDDLLITVTNLRRALDGTTEGSQR